MAISDNREKTIWFEVLVKKVVQEIQIILRYVTTVKCFFVSVIFRYSSGKFLQHGNKPCESIYLHKCILSRCPLLWLLLLKIGSIYSVLLFFFRFFFCWCNQKNGKPGFLKHIKTRIFIFSLIFTDSEKIKIFAIYCCRQL